VAESVNLHSIIAVEGNGPVEQRDDGVVKPRIAAAATKYAEPINRNDAHGSA